MIKSTCISWQKNGKMYSCTLFYENLYILYNCYLCVLELAMLGQLFEMEDFFLTLWAYFFSFL